MTRVKVAAVSYLNTRPFIYGIEQSDFIRSVDLVLRHPADCAEAFIRGEVDAALIPVAEIPKASNCRLITDYCLGAVSNVRTVEVMSNSPIEKVDRIFLDTHSRTSVALLRYLAANYWNITPEWDVYRGENNNIADNEAVLLIGDKVFSYENIYKYSYDLAEAWIDHTGLPFVFAAWVARDNVGSQFETKLNEALKFGVSSIPAMDLTPLQYDYLTRNLSFDFDNSKHESLKLFWERAVNPG